MRHVEKVFGAISREYMPVDSKPFSPHKVAFLPGTREFLSPVFSLASAGRFCSNQVNGQSNHLLWLTAMTIPSSYWLLGSKCSAE